MPTGPLWNLSGSPRIHIGSVVGQEVAPTWNYLCTLTDPFWCLDGTLLAHYLILCGSEPGPLWAYSDLLWILRGSPRDLPWVKLGPNLELSKLGPYRNFIGSFPDPLDQR